MIFSLQLFSKADDIKEFEIEGYSIGDSLLNHFSKKEIENARFEFISKNKKYSYSEISGKFENFESLQFIYERYDKEYEIFAIVGIIFYDNDLDSCLRKKNLMVQSVESIMPSEMDKYNNDGYPHSGQFPKSLIYTTEFTFKNGDIARIYCLNWSSDVEKKQGWTDHLSLNIQTKKFIYWLNNEAYK